MFDSQDNSHDHYHGQNRFAVIPTAEKLNADPDRSGRGVCIAFLDSGFYQHPDFVDRVVAFHDIAGEEQVFGQVMEPKGYHWHGTQTVNACCGDGSLSNGVYRGLAFDAELVLVKVSRGGRIGDSEIEAGLNWVLENQRQYRIRVLNISLGGDCDLPSVDSRINSLIEQLVSSGVVVTVSAGNSAEMPTLPPASAPAAITVGGYSDGNKRGASSIDLYHSNFGATVDGLIKPELIAPSMYIAAPILPGTRDYEVAEMLSMLITAPDYSFRSLLEECWDRAGLLENILHESDDVARRSIEEEIDRRKIVSTHYQHVDGTSFAAPITASLVAQMLEANPSLTPASVKNILVATAVRLSDHPAVRQGFGILNAQAAVDLAARESHDLHATDFHPPRIVGEEIIFTYHDDAASRITLAGDFNQWDRGLMPLNICDDGLWRVSIPRSAPGKYRYKFLIDDRRWSEDPSHLFKEEDGFGGFNSLLIISENAE